MILSEVRQYLEQHGRVALTDMVYRFEADEEAIRRMLQILERKGKVRRLSSGTCDSGCSKCDVAKLEFFEWVEGGKP